MMRHHPAVPLLVAMVFTLLPVTQARACTTRPLPLTTLPGELNLPAPKAVTQAWSCKDSKGEEMVVATHSASKHPDDGKDTELGFFKFRQTPAGWKKDWQARDFRPSTSKPTELILLGDYDGDGQAEVFIAYALPGQPSEPDEGKLLVFYKDQKYAIRGAIARSPSDFGSRKISARFLTLPQAIQNQAFRLWDKLNSPSR